MEINRSHLENRTLLVTTVLEHIDQKRSEVGDTPNDFVECYLAKFPVEEWLGRDSSDLAGFLMAQWLVLQGSPKTSPHVDVYNPNLNEYGWVCGRTVIVILQKDMPFLVDSTRIALNRKEAPIHTIYSCVMHVARDENGSPLKVVNGHQDAGESINGAVWSKEALIYVEISLVADSSAIAQIKSALTTTIRDVESVVRDYQPIRDRLQKVKTSYASIDKSGARVADFLQWLTEKHFTFLGYREFEYTEEGNKKGLLEKNAERLGVFTQIKIGKNFVDEADYTIGAKCFYNTDQLVGFSKSSTRSNVHRDVYPDYVVVKKINSEGNVCGEIRFLGLFTYEVFQMSPMAIPLLGEKVESLIKMSGRDINSHDGKHFSRIIDSFPKEELFQSNIEDLYQNISTIASINERHVVRLIVSKDPFGCFINCLVYVPRDVYNTRIRIQIQELLGEALDSKECDATTYFSESTLARAQFVFKVNDADKLELDVNALEARISDLTKNWEEYLQSRLVDAHGETNGIQLFNRYSRSFSQSYQESFDARSAIEDIAMVESLKSEDDIAMNLYQPAGADASRLQFKVFHLHSPLELSDVIPILENLGLRVLGEHPYQITKKDKTCVWLHDFTLTFSLPGKLDVQTVRSHFEQAFEKIWSGQSESDAFNKLVLSARINWREVTMLRAYAGYLKQLTFTSTREFIAHTLVHHHEITRNLVALFKTLFDPRLVKEGQSHERTERLKEKILDSLDNVANLNEDIVLRRYLDLLNATLRTNYFQKDQAGKDKNYLSLKFHPQSIADIPEPRPEFEIFVYSPSVEGVHLRGGKVARGGLRWSDRIQDFRTEVLGLVKAQQVKNAVIVPSGAKGGFVAKKIRKDWSRQEFLDEGVSCYKTFIRGLLDITDNLVDGDVVPPHEVVSRDEPDPYLVVAADKGTATFSDIANEISHEYGHWLGDAFASGGSQGYDHKGMGITAKGAWVSVQRHFREKGIDVQSEDFTVIGIGDMGGDVFGNGMLLSEHICLVAAFNHLHIFIDPTPDSKSSFTERQRLFATPRTTWEDYDKALISKGGGVFSRGAKSLDITPEMKKAFAIEEDKLTPNDLINRLLKAPVDLIWNGGIGTYIKSKSETHSDVGDKANDGLRINGDELRCAVFGEGGNLGLTQLGRIDFALNGGACNTDFIDNAAGVDCSDHEVNIKILLDEVVNNGDLTNKQRNELLEDMTDTVSELVLKNNYRQTFAISIAEHEIDQRINEYRRFISFLEKEGRLNRALEYLPRDEEIVERIGRSRALTRPELSVLISYAKVMLKEDLSDSDFAHDQYVSKDVETAFPEKLNQQYKPLVESHRLRKEIVATQVANDLINNLGITSAHRLLETTGASIQDIAKAYIISRDIFRFEALQNYIQSLDNTVSSDFQAEMMANMIRRVRRGTRWFLKNRRSGLSPEKEVPVFLQGLQDVYTLTNEVVVGVAKEDWFSRIEHFENKGVKEEWARTLSMPSNMFSGLGVVQASLSSGRSMHAVTEVFYLLLDELNLNWFASQLSNVNVESYWQALARESYLDDLEAQVRKLSEALLRIQGERTIQETYNLWQEKNTYLVDRWKEMVNQVQGSQVTDYAMFSVALRELIDLTQAADHCESL